MSDINMMQEGRRVIYITQTMEVKYSAWGVKIPSVINFAWGVKKYYMDNALDIFPLLFALQNV